MEWILQNFLTPVLIVVIGKYIDNKVERYRQNRAEEKAQEMAKEQEIRANVELIGMGLRSVLRDRILEACKYNIDKGSIEPIALENITRMHDSYKLLGGNGLCDHLFETVQELPLEG